VVRKVTFPGVNIGIGRLRNITWAKDNDSKKWVADNRLWGQYMSALEHAVPERFFNDPAQCNLEGASTPVAGLPDCPQGISGVKVVGLAAAQEQKIYTITQKVYNDNPNIVGTALSAHSYDTKITVGLAGVSGQYDYSQLCLTSTQGAAFNSAITALGFLGQRGGLLPGTTAISAIGVYTALAILLIETIHFININRAIGDC